MSKRRNKKNGGFFTTCIVLALALALVFPLLSALNAGGGSPSGGGSVTPPVVDTPGTDTPGTDTPGTDTPGTDTPGTDTPGTDTPGAGDDPLGDIVLPEGVDKFAYAVGRINEKGQCLHNRLKYLGADMSYKDSCRMEYACYRCNGYVINTFGSITNFCYHHFANGVCTVCEAECEHDFGSGEYCIYGCGVGCDGHTFVDGPTDKGAKEIYFYGIYGNGTVDTSDIKANAARICSKCTHRCYHPNVSETYTKQNDYTCHFVEKCDDCGYVFGETSVLHDLSEGICNLCGGTGTKCTEHTYGTNGICARCGDVCAHPTRTTKYNADATTHTALAVCTKCGDADVTLTAAHTYTGGKCTVCEYSCPHKWTNGQCDYCELYCSHEYWGSGDTTCIRCGMSCTHPSYTTAYEATDTEHTLIRKCARCKHPIDSMEPAAHTFKDRVCTVCAYKCVVHSYDNSVCRYCGFVCEHPGSWQDNYCTYCGYHCTDHVYEKCKCTICGFECGRVLPHTFVNGVCQECGFVCEHSGSWRDSHCTYCGYHCTDHTYEGGICTVCGHECTHPNGGSAIACPDCGECCHSYGEDPHTCVRCGYYTNHDIVEGKCTICGAECGRAFPHDFVNGVCLTCGTKEEDYNP